MRIMRAILIIFAIPAVIYVINAFQDYTEAEMSLNTYEQFFMGLLPFLVIGLFVFGIFKAIQRSHKDSGDE